MGRVKASSCTSQCLTVVSLVVVMAAGGLVSQAVIRITIKKNGENYDE